MLSAFFLFGFLMCMLTLVMLSFPGTLLDPLWRLNPEARDAFKSMGRSAVLLMAAVGTACLFSSVGLAAKAQWGRPLAISVLAVNLLGDTIAALIRHDPRTLIGIPIGGAMLWFLTSSQVRHIFVRPVSPKHPSRGTSA